MAPTKQKATEVAKKKKRNPYMDTRAKFIVREQQIKKRHKQMEEFCKANNCRGKKAVVQALCNLLICFEARTMGFTRVR